jgi:hypothetical protein
MADFSSGNFRLYSFMFIALTARFDLFVITASFALFLGVI